jgi:hypothetical protein
MQLTHVSIATVGRLPMFLGEGPRRAALHVLGDQLGGRIVVFAIVDDHIHLVLLASLAEVGTLARNLAFALAPLVSPALQPPHVEPVLDDGHLRSLVRYALEQPVHHGVGEHPALASGSCFAEIVGARAVPGLVLQFEKVFPREATRPELGPIVGLAAPAPTLASPLVVRRLGAYRLALAAAFAAGVASLDGQDPPAIAARRVVVQLGIEAGIDAAELAFALGIDRNSVRRLQGRGADPALLDATRTRLALEQEVAAACRGTAIQALASAIAQRKAGLGRSRLATRVG